MITPIAPQDELKHSSTMQYKVVPFTAAVSSTEDASNVAFQVQSIIDSYASTGWEFVGVYQLQTFKAGSSGCFGFGATPPTSITSEFIVLRTP
jgi:hypothetical protein